jgi:hypothetical protein
VPWADQFRAFVATASPKELWADETGFLVGGDADSTGYRSTADAGWQLIRQIDGHMQAGCTASFPWMLQDQRWWYDASIFLKYGVAGDPTVDNSVHPAYYAFALHANLTGGGSGTSLYRMLSSTATLHGTAVFIPYGVTNAVNPAGEWTFVVINEDIATDAGLNFGASMNGRTVYRYDYSGEYPPQATGPFLPAWTMKFTGVGTSIPATRIPGRGVSIFSTMNISAPTAENLALQAVATSSDAAASGAPPTSMTATGRTARAHRTAGRKARTAASPLRSPGAGGDHRAGQSRLRCDHRGRDVGDLRRLLDPGPAGGLHRRILERGELGPGRERDGQRPAEPVAFVRPGVDDQRSA